MKRVPNSPIPGHYLLMEGHIEPIRDYSTDPYGPAYGKIVGQRGGCQCGAKPSGFPNVSINEMKKWHRKHKADVRLVGDIREKQ